MRLRADAITIIRLKMDYATQYNPIVNAIGNGKSPQAADSSYIEQPATSNAPRLACNF